MAKIDLSKYGISGTTEIVHNPSYELLFEEETKPELEGFEKGQESELGAVNVMTGIYTGRSPKDKFIVVDENSKDTVWWTSDEYKNDNHPATQEAWKAVKDMACKDRAMGAQQALFHPRNAAQVAADSVDHEKPPERKIRSVLFTQIFKIFYSKCANSGLES